jgi:BirA family biotin operon repressor/biotin-[acetyl-CoA-carboxylase] ligase
MNLDWRHIANELGDAATLLRCHVVTDAISSTNDWTAWSCGDDQLPAVCLAEKQVAGRGRKSRSWVSPASENIYFSLVWPYALEAVGNLNGLSLVAGIVIARVLSMYGMNAKVKWPNDVLVNGGKFAGVLIETKIKDGMAVVIIGVGINYALSEKSRSLISQVCSDFMSCCSIRPLPDRNQVAGRVIRSLMQACEIFAHSGFAAFVDEWEKFDMCFGQEITVQDASGVWTGKVIGLNDQCALRVLRENRESVVYAADVSIRVK